MKGIKFMQEAEIQLPVDHLHDLSHLTVRNYMLLMTPQWNST